MPEPTIPRVTAVVPVFNGAELVGRAVASIISQDYPNLAVLILDDGSLDGGGSVAARASANCENVRIFRDSTNKGLAQTLNDSLRFAEGEYLLVVHQDCELIGRKWIARAVESAQQLGAAEVTGKPVHNVAEMGSLEKLFWIIRAHAANSDAKSRRSERASLFSENKCDLFLKSALSLVGGFPQGFREGGEDQALAIEFHERGLKTVVSDNLAFRISIGHSETLGSNLAKESSYGRQMSQIIRRVGRKVVRLSHDGSLDPRLVNRLAGVGWIMSTVTFGVVIGILGHWPWWPTLLIPLSLRFGQFTVRAGRQRGEYNLTRADIARVGTFGLVADLCYSFGLLASAVTDPLKPKRFGVDQQPRRWIQLD